MCCSNYTYYKKLMQDHIRRSITERIEFQKRFYRKPMCEFKPPSCSPATIDNVKMNQTRRVMLYQDAYIK